MNDDKLRNKSNCWNSNDKWSFKPAEDNMFYVANISNSTVLGISNQKVKEESMIENDPRQMWELIANLEGYFSVRNPFSQTVLTAVSTDCLETKGMNEI